MAFADVIKYMEKHVNTLLGVPIAANAVTFGADLVLASYDGVIDEQEFHDLFLGASAVQMGMILLVMAVLRIARFYNKQDKQPKG